MHEQLMNRIFLKKIRLDVMQSHPLRRMLWPIPSLISCTGVTGRWGLLSHAQNAVRWPALSKRLVEALQSYHLLVQLSFVRLKVLVIVIVTCFTNACTHTCTSCICCSSFPQLTLAFATSSQCLKHEPLQYTGTQQLGIYVHTHMY